MNTRQMLKRAAAKGRHGDSMLVHVGQAEVAMLKRAGGAGTRNPQTGLLEFYTPEGGAGMSKDTASGARKDRPGARDNSSAGKDKDNSNPFDSRLKNPRYERKKTKQFEATWNNMMKLGGTILGGAMMPGAMTGLGPLVGEVTGLGPQFEKELGTTDTFNYDPKNTAQTTEAAEEDKKLAPRRPKKKKPILKGFTLLDDAGGTMLGD